MGIRYEDLNETTRPFMVEESLLGFHYESPRLTADGLQAWRPLLTTALERHNDDWLASQILNSGFVNSHEKWAKGVRRVNQPASAQMLAEGEFNRFHLRGLCRYAKTIRLQYLVVYRGKPVSQPRPESEAKIGSLVDVDELLATLRKTDFVSIESHLAIPSGPNSGLTARLATTPAEAELSAYKRTT